MTPPGIKAGARVAVVDASGALRRIDYVTRITRSTIRVAPPRGHKGLGYDKDAHPWPLNGTLGDKRLRAVTPDDERDLRLRALRKALSDATFYRVDAAKWLADAEREVATRRATFDKRVAAEGAAIDALEAEEARPIT